MSGHSKWANIKHRKAAQDAKRGKIFNKLIREITVAARLGGGDPETNPRLKTAIARARSNNMPMDTIEKAIKRGTGELEGVSYEELIYEGYGPGGVAIMVEVMTDNRNRTAAEIRKIFSKHGGKMGESGSVAWMFKRVGLITLDATKYSEDEVMEVALDAGAEDIKSDGKNIEVYTDPDSFAEVLEAIKGAGLEVLNASVTRIPTMEVKLSGEDALKMLKLMDELEDHDDVQNVSANFDIDESVMEQYANAA